MKFFFFFFFVKVTYRRQCLFSGFLQLTNPSESAREKKMPLVLLLITTRRLMWIVFHSWGFRFIVN